MGEDLLPREFCWLSVLSNLGVADRQFRSERKPTLVFVEGFVVENAEHELLLLITAGDADPHPLANARGLIGKLNLHVVAALKRWRRAALVSVGIHSLARSLVASRKPAGWGPAAVLLE